jgi:Spy/CpxP family protein refolding chaperone
MKLKGTLILILLPALAAFSGLAWTAADEKPVCPLTGEPAVCTADGPHGPHGPAAPYHQPERMAAALDLTDEQREALHEIMSAERDAIRQRVETALTGILTPEQLEQLDEIKARRESRGEMDRPGRKGRKSRKSMRDGDRGDMAARRLERMTEELDLTPEQQDRIRQILEESAPPPRTGTRDRIREVLTPGQQEKMDQRHPQRPGMGDVEGKGGRHGRGPAGGGMGPLDHLARALQLTDEQRQAVRELMAEIHAEQINQTRSRIEALLTPEQREKLEQLHK